MSECWQIAAVNLLVALAAHVRLEQYKRKRKRKRAQKGL